MLPLPPALRSLLFPALVLALCLAGWRTYGWPGLLLALLMSSFWALLHFTKLMRLLRAAAGRPIGELEDVRLLHGRLRTGMPMHEVVRHARCLGQRLPEAADNVEWFAWRDAGGRALHLGFVSGRLSQIVRMDNPPEPQGMPDAP